MAIIFLLFFKGCVTLTCIFNNACIIWTVWGLSRNGNTLNALFFFCLASFSKYYVVRFTHVINHVFNYFYCCIIFNYETILVYILLLVGICIASGLGLYRQYCYEDSCTGVIAYLHEFF